MWRATILTLFPEMFPGVLGASITGDALARRLWGCEAIDIRRYATDKHQTVDDTPFGGGAGMVMRPDIIDSALKHIALDGRPRIYLSPHGQPFNQKLATDLASGEGVILLCGRYEGVDQRVIEANHLQEISLGDYVLSGGELAAQVVLDACVRLLPGVLGNPDTLSEESFTSGLLEYPHYTRPRVWQGLEVPAVLLSGHHAQIKQWRQEQAERITKQKRPDLWVNYTRPRSHKGDES